MDALTPHPDCDAMCAAIAAAGQEAANPDAKNRQALFERAIRDVLDLRAHAMEIHFRQARNPEARRKAHRTRKCAERRVGELLIAAERAGLRYIRQKTKKIGAPTDLITLEKLGITRKQSQDWQGLARKSESEFEAWLEAELAKKSQRRSRRRNAHAQPAAAGALVPIRPGIQLPGRVTRTGWKLPKDMSFEDWLTCGQVLDLAEDAVQWWRGDWWAFGSGRQWGEGPELAEKADINYQTIRDYGWVAGAFKDLSRRRDNLTFEHHRVVASLDVADQEKWLDLAESGGWSRAELRRELRYGLKVARQAELDGEKDGHQSESTLFDQAPSSSPQTPPEPESAATPASQEPMWSNDDAPAALELASEPNADVVPPIAPVEPVPSPDRATPDNVHVLADLPIDLEPKEKELSLDEKVGNLIFLIESQINVLVPEVRAAGRLPELFRRVRKSIDKLEAEAAADDCNVAIDHATPVLEQMPPTPTSPDLPPAA